MTITMVTLGKRHVLTVLKSASIGFYLDAEEMGEVLLPGRYAPHDLVVGDLIEVFLYLDSEDRPIATTETPKACVGQFAYLPVVGVNSVGAFLDWGLSKDVLVPFGEQHRPLKEGNSYLVYLYIDKVDGRIVASSKVDKWLKDDKPHSYKPREEVDLILANSTDLGYKTIINHSHWGVLHSSDVHQRVSFGQALKGIIKNLRADGKIDVHLSGGQGNRDAHSALIEKYLCEKGGFAAVHDKSDPEQIKKLFNMSKGAFKKAIGKLYKQQRITIAEDGIRLVSDEQPPEESAVSTTDALDINLVKESDVAAAEQHDQVDQSDGRIVEVTKEPIELYKILKFEGMVGSGGEAKTVIAEGLVLVNGKVELQKRKKIRSGDTIEFLDEKIHINLSK